MGNKTSDRQYMEMAIAEMHRSIQEPRDDKVSPKVGSVLVKANGEVNKAHRGELRHGDHAEFTLLEKKNRFVPLDGGVVYATLEPCAPGARKHPKLSCAERLVNARIKTVWVGIEDPDPTVDRKGIKYLQDHGVEVKMFDHDLQQEIRQANKTFIEQAEERAKNVEKHTISILSQIENVNLTSSLEDLSRSVLIKFIEKAGLDVEFDSPDFYKILHKIGLLSIEDNAYLPTGLGVLLFGRKPAYTYQQAVIRLTYKTKGSGEEIETISGPLVNQPAQVEKWYNTHLGKQIDRSSSERKRILEYPYKIVREAIVNAIVHRDYEIEGAPIYVEINDEAIIIKSPGTPILPITLEQIQSFKAPSLSRNPKIMYIFDQMGLAEQRGLGFSSFKEITEEFSLPKPYVSFDDPYIVFTFPRVEIVEPVFDSNTTSRASSDAISLLNSLGHFRSDGRFTRKEYEERFEMDKKKAERTIKVMIELGLIVRKGAGPNTYYKIISP